MLEETIQAVCEHKIITIVRGLRPEHMLQLAQALYDGGLRMMEITFNQAHPEHGRTLRRRSTSCGRLLRAGCTLAQAQ